MSQEPSPSLSVLVVDDNPGDRRLIQARLAQSRYAAFTVSTEAALSPALALLGAERFDCVVLDLTLPDSKGAASVTPVVAAAKGAPVVVLTGVDDEEVGMAAVTAGAQDFLYKEFAMGAHALARAIRHAIQRGRVDAELRATRERLEFAERLARVGSFEEDLRTGKSAWSDELYRMSGFEPGAVPPTFDAFLEIVHPEDRERAVAAVEDWRRSGGGTYECRIVRPDGGVRVHQVTAVVEKGPDGAPLRVRGAVLDLTDLKQAQQQLESSEKAYRELFQEHPGAMWVAELETMRFLATNAAASAQYGYAPEEFRAMTIADLRTPENVSELPELVAQAASCQTSLITEHRRKDGSRLEVEITAVPIDFGGRRATLVRGRDVTREQRALRELAESEARYRALFDAVPSGLIVIDMERREVLDLNAAALAIYGYERDEVLGLPSERLSAQPETHKGLLDKIERGETLDSMERMHRRRDGSVFVAELHVHGTEVGGKSASLAVVRDVTLETETRVRFKRMAESISQVFWMTDVAKSSMIYVSPAYEKIWGRTCRDLYASPLTWLESIVEEDRERVMAALPKQQAGTYDERYRIRRPDGSVRWIRDRAFPVKDPSGKVVQVAGVAEDVTDQRLAEQARMRSESWLETAQDIANIGAWMASSAEEASTVWSRGMFDILGLPRSSKMTTGGFYKLIHPADVEAVKAAAGKARETGTEYSAEYRIIRPDGEVRWVHSVARPASEPGTLIGVLRDITDSMRAKERLLATELQLRQAQKMEAVGRLAGGVAHDFNNLLTAILGMAELSLAELPKTHPVAKDLKDIRETALRAAGLTQQLLAFSRRQFVEPKVLDLNEVIDGLAKMLRRLIGEDVKLEFKPGPESPVVRMDRSQLEQLLINLAVNARDAMPDGGTLSVSIDVVDVSAEQAQTEGIPTVGAHALLVVSDTGAGMSDDVKSHLFEPFYTTKGPGKGTGLGLATCYGIVKQGGGGIACDSEPGRGASFRVYLPLVSDMPDAQRPRKDPRRRAASRGETVLVVEDEASVRSLMLRALGEAGYRALEAEDGEAGLRAVRSDKRKSIKMLVTDTVMPKMGGKKLADTVAVERPDIKVLFTSGYTDDVIVREGIESSSIPFLRKPFTTQALTAKVREVLARRGLKRRLSEA